MQEYKHLTHTFEPIYNKDSKILILGSFPSVKSRENDFYYGHPQNRYWKVIAKVLGVEVPQTIDEKKAMLLNSHIAIWDVIHSCSIMGSSDTSIKDVVVNDFSEILNNSNIKTIYVNGGKAYELYHKYAEKQTGIKAVKLPSTSPANAAWNLESLCQSWIQIKDKLDNNNVTATDEPFTESNIAATMSDKAQNASVASDKPYFTYMLRCSDNSIYTGITTDLERRFKQHQGKRAGGAKYTRVKEPIRIEHAWISANRQLASKLEYRLKRLSKVDKELLVCEPNKLQKLLADKLECSNYELYF